MADKRQTRAAELESGSQKHSFIHYFFLLGAWGASLAAYFDFKQGYTVVGAIEVGVAITSVVFLFTVRSQAVPQLVVRLTTLIVYGLFAVSSFTHMDDIASLVWIPAYPIIFFFLSHFRTGLYWSLLTLLTAIVAYQVHPYIYLTQRVPVEALMQAISAYLFVGALAFIYEMLRSRQESLLQTQADYDYLTSIHNRRGLNHLLETEISRAERYGTRLSFMLLDLDNFKKVNDTFGHSVGDQLLREFSLLTRDSIRRSDTLARWGGEEFAILMPESDLQRATLMAEKLRAIIAEHEFETVGHITVSIGVTQYRLPESQDVMLNRADTALYRAKDAGKNRVEVETVPQRE